ncbi:MAG TPA: hypothetical protein VGR35_21470 [Tepidisphaeraceae bacterium]|nr:hypothetical protein [Tepidisphaeraceae bacterium]
MIRRNLTRATVVLLMLAGSALRAEVPATNPAAGDIRFLRFTGDARNGGILETSDVTYRNDAGVEVRLVAAVHIADQPYFQALNRSFRPADAVLYEMVKPKGAPAPRIGDPPSDAGIAQLQHFLKNRLNLAFQLDVINYQRPNFIHADMDAETFMAMQAQRGESFASLMLSSMLEALSNPSAGLNDPEQPQTLMELLARPDGERQFKLLIARQLGDLEASAMGLKGLNGTVILTERNKTVIKALKDALAGGKKKIAIFYGAAHMPDLSRQLEGMGFKPVDTTWYQAWDVRIRPNEPSAFQKIQDRMNQVREEQ